MGLRLNNYLTWSEHIDHVKTKLSALAISLRNITKCIPHQVRFTIYNSLVKSHLLYLIEVWGSATKTKLTELQIMQNKIVKTLFQYPYLTATNKIYNETKIMTVRQLYTYSTCILIRKIINKNINISLSFTKHSQIIKRSTRRASLLVLPKVRTNYGKRNITFEGAQLYNKLPPYIKNVNSFNVFKYKLLRYIQEKFLI